MLPVAALTALLASPAAAIPDPGYMMRTAFVDAESMYLTVGGGMENGTPVVM